MPEDKSRQSVANGHAITALTQLVTLASGSLVLTLTFLKDFANVGNHAHAPWLVYIGWLLLMLSIWTGWVSIPEAAGRISEDGDNVFVFTSGKLYYLTAIAQWSFYFGLLSIAIFCALNFNTNNQSGEKKGNSDQVDSLNRCSARIDSIGAIQRFTEGVSNDGYNSDQLNEVTVKIAKTKNIQSLIIIGEVDKRELYGKTASRFGSNISLARARAEFVKSKVSELCRKLDISILTMNRGAFNSAVETGKSSLSNDRQVVIYAIRISAK